MQKECALDADFGVRTGSKQECALEHPPKESTSYVVLHRGPRGREVRVEHLKKWAKGKDG